MTTAADDAAVEDAFEAYLAGRPVSGETADPFPGLAAFSEAVRATATQPGRPNAALAELLVTGLLTDQSSPSTRTATSAGSPPPRRAARVRIRRRTAMFLPALFAKLLSAGAIAQAATGAGVAVVVVTGAGAAGVLPGPVQDTVASVVGSVTPFELPSGDGAAAAAPTEATPTETTPAEETPAEETPATEQPETEQPTEGVVTDPAAFDADAWAVDGPQAGETFGQWVSLGAHNKALLGDGVKFGQIVSTWAHKKHLDATELENEGVDLGDLTDDSATAPAPAVEPAANDDQQAAPATHGKGGVNGSGHGTSAGKGSGSNGSNGKGSGSGNSKGNGHH